MPDLICVDPARAHEIWPHVKALIRSAIEATDISDFEEIERAVLAGQQLLWLAAEGRKIVAVAATQLARARGKICVITACAGHDRDRWLPLISRIEKYAKDEGCSSMRIYGRRGWERLLDGYKSRHVIMEKAL